MQALRVNLFGRFRILDPQQAVTQLPQRRAQELFSYLLLHRNRPHPRETLAGLLWEDADASQARKYLRQALWQIQTTLQKAMGDAAKDLLTLDAEWVQLNSADCLSLDVALFEQAVAACRGTPGVQLSPMQCRELEHAVQLYHGDLLEGWYQDWCLFERERLRNCYLAALDKLLACCDSNGSVECGLAYAECILRCDPAEEQAHYHIMHLHWLAGHRTKAMRQYRCCEKILLQELGIQPSECTKRLYEQIRDDKHEPLPDGEPTTRPGALPPAGGAATEVMGILRQLQAHLGNLEQQIQNALQAGTLALKDRH